MSQPNELEVLFNETLIKQNQLRDYEKSATTYQVENYLKEIVGNYSIILKTIPKEKSSRFNRGIAKARLAELYIHVKQNNEAIDKFNSAVGDFSMVLAYDSSYVAAYNARASANTEIAKLYEEDGENLLTIEHLRYANDDYHRVLASKNKDIDILDEISINMDKIAKQYRELTDYHKAISFFEKSIEYAKKILFIDSKDIDSLGNIPSTKSDMSKIYALLGQKREAIKFYNEAIAEFLVFLSIYPNEVIVFNNIAITYTELANIYRYEMIKEQDESFMQKAENLYRESVKYYEKSIELDKEDIPTIINQAGNYYELGTFYLYIKENEKSIEHLEKSRNILYAVDSNNYHHISNTISSVELKLAEAYKRSGKADKSLEILKKSTSLFSKNMANKKSEIARFYLAKNMIDEALNYFDNAFHDYVIELENKADNLMVLENFSLMLSELLKISVDEIYLNKAVECNQKIIKIYDGYFVDIGLEDDVFDLTHKMSTALERLLDAYVKGSIKADESLIEYLEMVKAKRFKQLYFTNLFDNVENWLDKNSRVKFEELRIKLNNIKREIIEEDTFFDNSKRENLYEKFQDYSQQLFRYLDEEFEVELYEGLEHESVVIYPLYFGEKLTIVSVQRIENGLNVQVFQTNKSLNVDFSAYFIFIKYIEDRLKKELAIPQEYLKNIANIPIDDEIKEHLFDIDDSSNFTSLKITKDEFFHKYKYEIVKLALSHIENMIVKAIPKGIEKIFFAPIGELNLLPLHAISMEECYLIEKYEISYIPSLSLLNHLQSSSNQDDNNLFVSLSKDELHIEAKEAQILLGGEHLVDIRAKDFIDSVNEKSFNLIHFSTHGHANILNPLQSYIEFHDSLLSLMDIHGLKLDANLVVLSACETYLSKIKGADEVLAFERAFLIAGARTVVSTFSTVNTIRAEEFMQEFYKYMKSELSFNLAFQQSCIEDIEAKSSEWMLFRFTGA